MASEAPVIVRSRAQCMGCLDIIESRHRHDFVRCGCGDVFLDGGTEYVRFGTTGRDRINLLTEYGRDE